MKKKDLGIVLIAIGGLMLLSGINLALTKYNLSSSDDLSKCIGGGAVSLGILTTGIFLFTRGDRKDQ
jgi:hypothetical protein